MIRPGTGNSRNGFTAKRLGTEVGDMDLATPWDRLGSFEPRLVPKGQRRVGGLSDMIISLYAGGMTIRDIQARLERTFGTELSHETKYHRRGAGGGEGVAGPSVAGSTLAVSSDRCESSSCLLTCPSLHGYVRCLVSPPGVL
jgi:hypothetical protein